jgi:hypothetical protein
MKSWEDATGCGADFIAHNLLWAPKMENTAYQF